MLNWSIHKQKFVQSSSLFSQKLHLIFNIQFEK